MASSQSIDQKNKAKKCQKKSNDCENEDRISKLPHSVLSDILSKMPEKQAIRTSVLAAHWRYLWALLPTLRFIMPHRDNHTEMMRYMDFVERVMFFRNGMRIREFQFYCYGRLRSYNRINALITDVLKRKIEIFDLYLEGPQGKGIKLPKDLFLTKYETLVELKLSNYIILHVPANVCFPSLKVIILRSVTYSNDASIRNLLHGSPILEELTVERSMYIMVDNVKVFDVSSPTLKRLTLTFLVELEDINRNEKIVIIKAPKLEYVNLSDNISGDYIVDDFFPNLVAASVNIEINSINWRFSANRLYGVLKSFSGVESLELSGLTLESLALGNDTVRFVFPNLVSLVLDIDDFNGWYLLKYLLVVMPNLEAITFTSLASDGEFRFNWFPPVQVPVCVERKLKTIVIRSFKGQKEEMRLVKYFLENARVLTSIDIFCCPSPEPNISNKLASIFINPQPLATLVSLCSKLSHKLSSSSLSFTFLKSNFFFG